MAKQPFDPRQRAKDIIRGEQEAKQVAAALEQLRRQLDPTRESLQRTEKAAGVFRSVTFGLQTIASMGGQPAAAIGAVSGQIGNLLGMAGPWGAAVGTFVSTLGQLPQLFKSAGDSIASYVAKFSPATAARYEQAWNDLSAAIGGYLTPVLETVTGVVRWFGDALAGWQPVIQPVIDQVTGLVGSFGGAFGDTINSLMEISGVITSALMPFAQIMIDLSAGPLKLVTHMLGQFADWLHTIAMQLAIFFGIDVPKFEGSSAGMAARGTGVSSVQGMLSTLQQRAFALGGSGGKGDNPAVKAVDIMGRVWEWLTKDLPGVMRDKLLELYEWVKTLIDPAIKVITNTTEVVTGGASSGIATASAGAHVMLNRLLQVVPSSFPRFGQ